jgi:hypothetical protein
MEIGILFFAIGLLAMVLTKFMKVSQDARDSYRSVSGTKCTNCGERIPSAFKSCAACGTVK